MFHRLEKQQEFRPCFMLACTCKTHPETKNPTETHNWQNQEPDRKSGNMGETPAKPKHQNHEHKRKAKSTTSKTKSMT